MIIHTFQRFYTFGTVLIVILIVVVNGKQTGLRRVVQLTEDVNNNKNSNNIDHTSDENRDLISLDDDFRPRCEFTGFSMYNNTSKQWVPIVSAFIDGDFRSQVILQNYDKDSYYNIRVEYDESGCGQNESFQCVEMKFNDIRQRKQKRTSNGIFTLHNTPTKWTPLPSNKQGFQKLEVRAYNRSDCSGSDICDDKLYINVIEKPKIDVIPPSIVVTYNKDAMTNTNNNNNVPSVSTQKGQGLEISKAACKYVEESFTNYLPRGSLSFDKEHYKCWESSVAYSGGGTASSSGGSGGDDSGDDSSDDSGSSSNNNNNNHNNNKQETMKIQYNFIVLFNYTSRVSVYSNLLPPNNTEIQKYISDLFNDEIITISTPKEKGPKQKEQLMSSFIRTKVNKSKYGFFDFSKVTIP